MALSVGVDIGQAADPTAIIVAETYRPQRIDAAEPAPARRHRVRWVERVPLGTLYGTVVERVAAVAEAAQSWGPTMMVLDATGVGRPIVDMLKRQTSVPLRAVTFTSGEHETQPEYDCHRVPKVDLVTSLETVLQSRRLEVTPDCPLRDDLAAELGAFDFAMSDRGHASFEAASGSHDDLVMALCLAIWWGERSGLQAEAFHELAEQVRRRGVGGAPL